MSAWRNEKAQNVIYVPDARLWNVRTTANIFAAQLRNKEWK